MTTTKNTSLANESQPASASWSKKIRLLFVCCFVLALPVGGVVGPCAMHMCNAIQERNKLLYDTDYPALLAASRTLIRDYPGEHISDPEHDPRVPDIIRDLGPSYLYIHADQLYVELHGGFDHYGFIALAADAPLRIPGRKLIDGLYYYSE